MSMPVATPTSRQPTPVMLSAGAKHTPAAQGSAHTRNISTDSLTRNIRALAAQARDSPRTPAAERPALVPAAAIGAGANAGPAAQPPRSEERACSSRASAGLEGRAHGWRPGPSSPALAQARRSHQAVHTPSGPESSPALGGTWPLDSPVYRSTVTPDLGAAVQVNLSTIPLARMASPAVQAHSVAEEVWPALSDSMLRYGFSSEHLPDLWQAICERAGAPGKVTPTRRGPAELQSPSERAQSPGVRERNAKLLNARHAEAARREAGSEQAEDDSASARVLMLSEDSRLQAMSSEHRTLWAQLQALRVEPLRASDAQQRPAAVSTRSGTSACSAASPQELHSPLNSSGLASAERRAGLAVHRLAGPAHPLRAVAEMQSAEGSCGRLSAAQSCDSLPPGGADPESQTPRAAASCRPQADRSGAELRCSRMVAGVDPTPTPPTVGTGLPAQSLLTSDATSGSGTSTSHPQPLLLLRQQQQGSGKLAPQHRLAARHEPASSPVNTARSTGTVQSAFSAHASRRSSALDSAYGTRTMWSSVSESGAGSARSMQVNGAARAKQQYMREVKKLRAKLAREQPDLAPDFRPGVGLADALYSSDLIDDAGERRAPARAAKPAGSSVAALQSSAPIARGQGRRVSPHRGPGSMQRARRLSDSQSAVAGPCRRTGALSPAKSVKRKPRAQGSARAGMPDSSHRGQLARSPHSSAGPKRAVAVAAGISPTGAKNRARGPAAAAAASLSAVPLGSSSSCVYPSRVRTSSASSKSNRKAGAAAAGTAGAAAGAGAAGAGAAGTAAGASAAASVSSARPRPGSNKPRQDARRRRPKVRRTVDPLQTVSELYASDSSRMAPSHSLTFAQHSLRMDGAGAAWRATGSRAPAPGPHARAGVPTLSMHRLVADEPDPLTPRRWPQGSALEPEDCPYLLDSARRVTDVMSVASRTTFGADSDDQLEWSTGQELPDLRLPARSALVPQLRLQPGGSQSVASVRRRSDGPDPMVSPRSAFSRTSSIATDVHSAR